jgi:tripartite-type tricarboxylate transporter receptor subunit TctC
MILETLMQRRTLLTTLGAAMLTAHPPLRAQGAYPQKPITLVVPSAPGGTTDFTARLIADSLSRALGQPVVVDNKAGAAGNIGNQLVAKAKPDGYTLLVAYSGYQVGNPHLYPNAGWDPIKDFTPVAMLTRAPQVIVTKANLPVNTLAELIAYAKANPGKLNYASSGNGSIQHIAGELFKQLTGTFITHIPYRGAGPAVQDLMGGQVDFVHDDTSGGGAASEGRQVEGAGGDERHALGRAASSADGGGGGSQRLHAGFVVRALRAGWDANGGGADAQHRGRQDPGHV